MHASVTSVQELASLPHMYIVHTDRTCFDTCTFNAVVTVTFTSKTDGTQDNKTTHDFDSDKTTQ